VTDPLPSSSEGQATPSWRDPASWKEDPATTAQLALSGAATTAQSALAAAATTAQSALSGATTTAQSALSGATTTAQSALSGATSTAQSAASSATGTAQSTAANVRVLTAERPETVIGAAFVGGLVSALILRRLAR
jgi:ElaB/YqjD/DUF883 family membrane-anchored ribosome-binding protein